MQISELKKAEAKAKREALELTFKQQLRAIGLVEWFKCEYEFHPKRKWRFDFASPAMKLAIEVEGGTTYGNSRHSYGKGFDDDAEKYNTASALGWTLFRFSSNMIKSGKAIMFVEDFLKGNYKPQIRKDQ
jgi:very-short-patch-repair endonuclease